MRRFKEAVTLVEVVNPGDPHQGSCLTLLLSAEGHNRVTLGRVEPAGVAIGHDAVTDLHTCRRPCSDRSCSAEINVIRMGSETEDPLNPGGRVERALR